MQNKVQSWSTRKDTNAAGKSSTFTEKWNEQVLWYRKCDVVGAQMKRVYTLQENKLLYKAFGAFHKRDFLTSRVAYDVAYCPRDQDWLHRNRHFLQPPRGMNNFPSSFWQVFFFYIHKSTKAAATAEALNMEQSTKHWKILHVTGKRSGLSLEQKTKMPVKWQSNNYENKLFE